MKTRKKQTKFIALTFAIMICFQSCKAYHSNSVTLEQASQEFKQTRIQTNNNEILKFKRIKVEDNKYFGVKIVKGEVINIPLEENNIKTIKLENETKSTVLTIASSVIVLAGILVITVKMGEKEILSYFPEN